MLKTHKELIEEQGSDVAIARQVADGKLHRVDRGVYSDKPYAPFVEIAMKRYPDAVVTMESAFFYQGLTDVIPDVLHLATDRAASRIADARICQHFVPAKILRVGATSIDYNGAAIRTYDLERLAIEVVRRFARARRSATDSLSSTASGSISSARRAKTLERSASRSRSSTPPKSLESSHGAGTHEFVFPIQDL
jgi:predicted transcriptional regulator of viral defense system